MLHCVVFLGNPELYLSYDAPEIPTNLPGKCVFPVCVCVYLVSVLKVGMVILKIATQTATDIPT